MVEMVPSNSNAIVIPIMMAVLNQYRLQDRFRGRGEKAVQRRAKRYLDNFDSIWRLQSYLLSEADRHQIPIIVSESREKTIRNVMNTIIGALYVQLNVEPNDVFHGATRARG